MPGKHELYIGIDLAFRKGKRLPVVVCTLEQGRLSPIARTLFKPPPAGQGNVLALDPEVRQKFAAEMLDWLRDAERRTGGEIQRIAIDAPQQYTRAGENRRRAEVEMDRLGISCFATPTKADFDAIIQKACAHLVGHGAISRLPHSNQIWMLVGFDLFSAFEPHYECIEVFPQAIAQILVPNTQHKSTSKGFDQQLAAIAHELGLEKMALEEKLGNLSYGNRDDKLDALMSAWVASLDQAKRKALGNPPDDAIWVPVLSARLPRKKLPDRPTKTISALGQRPDRAASKTRKRPSSKGTTEIGFVSNKNQKVIRHTGLPGTDHGQSIYVLQCGDCGHEYGTNGSGIGHRKCPDCQGGRPGLDYSEGGARR